MRIAQSLEVCTTAAHGDVERRPKKRWSDRGLQVIDLKAAAALSCSYMIGTDHTGSHTITVACTCMHHAPSHGHRRRLRGRRQTDTNPSNLRVATLSGVTRHHTRCVSTAGHSEDNAEATEKAASADHRVRPAVLR